MDIQPSNQEILSAVKDLFLSVRQNTSDIKDLGGAVQDILEVINEFSDRVDERFNRIEGDIVGVKLEIIGIKSDIVGVNSEIVGIKSTINTQVVTKDYLDQKISELRGNSIESVRGENKKLTATVNLLAVKKVFTKEEAAKVLILEPVV